MDFETIRLECADGVATITLHRPERLNAWAPVMGRELLEAFRAGQRFFAPTDARDKGPALRLRRVGFCPMFARRCAQSAHNRRLEAAWPERSKQG